MTSAQNHGEIWENLYKDGIMGWRTLADMLDGFEKMGRQGGI